MFYRPKHLIYNIPISLPQKSLMLQFNISGIIIAEHMYRSVVLRSEKDYRFGNRPLTPHTHTTPAFKI